ncbi:MAG: SPOR domain-containing protein [Spirochaetes bacterium]|nr:MAG: SPOR domain-containing protein [Spirochaetota bacterium]
MERFDDLHQKGIKEKNMYVFHMDTPRLIIIGCVIVGVIIIAFLFGMNLTKPGGKGADTLAQRDLVRGLPETDNLESRLLSPSDENILSPDGKKTELPLDDKHKPARKGDLAANDKSSKEFPAEEKEAENSVKDVKKAALDEETRPSRKSDSRKTEKAKSHKVVEVAAKEKKEKKDGSERAMRGYSIQVGSYDTSDKAKTEMSSLKKMSYDAFMDKATVNGKSFYRVKIGPLTSKGKAIDILREIQENNKYSESYLVKE